MNSLVFTHLGLFFLLFSVDRVSCGKERVAGSGVSWGDLPKVLSNTRN